MKQTVELTLENLEDQANKFTCKTSGGDTDRIFTCPGSAKGIEKVEPMINGVSVTATLKEEIVSTTKFRCSVTVGADSDDEKATDTKLIYAQKISVKYRNDNLDAYEKMTEDDSLTVSVYGDDAYSLQDSSTCKLGTAGTVTTSSSPFTIPNAKVEAGDKKLICTLNFDSDEVIANAVSYESDEPLKIAETCGDGKYWDTTCKSCPENTIRLTTSRSQFLECSPCPAGQEPDSANSACEACDPGKTSTATTTCSACPVGTKQEGNSCTPCPAGEFQTETGKTSCESCLDGQYSAALGSSTCTKCPAGSVPTSDKTGCTACLGGEFANSGDKECQKCNPGQYSLLGSSICTACPAGTVSKTQGASACEACEAGEIPNEKKGRL